ncbi:MAG: 2Fe-2S iron-sulfur cluster binding domain-containing protein [Planctomycetaceae bacterium]|nr:2Fe-2S iron-sulfur cluster binding domain-containing protein [Planctomycetaceae bacterium]
MSDAPATNTCTVTLNKGQKVLQCRKGMSLFAALRVNGVLLPTGCGARGLCGQCKVVVNSGETDLFTDNEVRLISELERAAGRRLACQLRLVGDIDVTVPEYVFDAREHAVTLAEITPLTHDIRRYSFRLPDGDAIPHRAGQFVTLVGKIPEPKSQPMRCFSFATPSRTTDHVDLIIRKNPKGILTPYLFDGAQVGEAFKMIGPFGDFFLRPGDEPCIWIGGGSGLSPFLGMLEDMMDKGQRRPVHLFFGAVLPSDLYYVDLLREVESRNDWFRFTPALSGDERSDQCRDYGLITDVVAKYVGDASGSQAYLCGGPGMIAACVKVLCEKGMCRDNIFYDRF